MAKLLRVYYGWTKLNKVAKREALCVMFLNDKTPPRINTDGMDGVSRFMTVCAHRLQSDKELSEASQSNRIYSVYNIFLDDKEIGGSLEKALTANFEADKNNVSEHERKRIMNLLRTGFISLHPGYKEPNPAQKTIEWNN